MSNKPDLQFQIILNFPGEPRISEFQPTDFDSAVQYALDFARKNRGVRVQVNLPVPKSPIHDHSYILFVCEFPVSEPFMQTAIQKHYGRLPY